ncbi:MAG: hypothetical protein K2X81_26550, partial [Candidatus Obscuribacterales bacterium]|nr:hypothetical protein [Candidatus Obscuribacterales bacterium]
MKLFIYSTSIVTTCLSTCAAYAQDVKDLPVVGTAPLTARVNLDVNNIKQREKYRNSLPPILIDAKTKESLSLERVL